MAKRCDYKATKLKSTWLSKESKAGLRKWNRAWSEYVKTKSDDRFLVYKSMRNTVVKSIRKDKAEYQKRLVRQMKNSPR